MTRPTRLPAAGSPRRFAVNVARERRALGLSVDELAARAGIRTSELQRLELGSEDPRLTTITCVAFTLDMTIADLLAGIGPRSAPAA